MIEDLKAIMAEMDTEIAEVKEAKEKHLKDGDKLNAYYCDETISTINSYRSMIIDVLKKHERR